MAGALTSGGIWVRPRNCGCQHRIVKHPHRRVHHHASYHPISALHRTIKSTLFAQNGRRGQLPGNPTATFGSKYEATPKSEAYDAFGTVSGSPHRYINHPVAVDNVLATEAGITDPTILAAALLHDTIEDTATTAQELEAEFGAQIAAVVAEVTDDKYLPKKERKRLQIEHAATLSEQAKLVKLADKIGKVRDMSRSPVVNWSLERKAEYFSWAKQVVDAMRGVSPVLESLFDKEFAGRSFGSKQ